MNISSLLQQRNLPIQNFVWHGDSAFDFSSIGDLGEAELVLASLSGQFAVHLSDGSRHLLARDALGVNKLFYAIEDGQVASSNYLFDPLRNGYSIDQIWSVPSGNSVYIDTELALVQRKKYSTLGLNEHTGETAGDIDAWAKKIRSALECAFRRIGQVASGRPVYVTMSGGADSTAIALLAKEHLSRVEGITLSVVRGGDRESEDVHFARMVARDLGIPLNVITAEAEDILEVVDETLIWGQDWRDFNVHCGVLNAALGRGLTRILANRNDSNLSLLLTGDAMNELMADYTPVQYRARELYQLPRLSRGQLRRFLVTGLDSGDREVGILAKMGFAVIQPFAMCAEAYLSVPAAFLDCPDAKQELARRVMDGRIPEYVLARPKVRAQAGGSKEIGGTLAVLLDAGLDEEYLKKRWCELFQISPSALAGIIRAGVYKCSSQRIQ